MKKLVAFCLLMIVAKVSNAQTTHHGVDANWYQMPKVAATISGNVSLTNYVGGAVANSMVVKSDGTVIIFYKHNGQNKWIQSSDGGNTWTSPGNLYPPAATSALSTIAADIDANDNIYILWKSGNFSLGFAKYNGTSWTSTTINTQTQTSSDTVQFSQITVDRKGRIHIMWQQGNHQNYSSGIKSTCWYGRSTDGGSTFSTALLSQGNQYHAAFPVADFGGTTSDTLMIAWRENVNGCQSPNPSPCSSNGWNWDVKGRITYDGGASWNAVFTVEGTGGANDTDNDQWDPNIVVDRNGVLHAFYHIYHNTVVADTNAKIMYEYSLDGGNTWSTPMQLSDTGVRSHLIKTAYDHTNNYVWCTWKDEIDFGNLPSKNPQADLKAVYIQNIGTPIISAQEYLTDADTFEVALHNFKVGNDGIMRATYNISKFEGKGDSIFYSQRNSLTTTKTASKDLFNVQIYPNPTSDYVMVFAPNMPSARIRVYNMMGMLVSEQPLKENKIFLPEKGLYFIEVSNESTIKTFKVLRQ